MTTTEAIALIGPDIIKRLAVELKAARVKHPGFARYHQEACAVVLEEMKEWADEVLPTPHMDSAEVEALHVMVTLIRWMRREYEQ